MDQSTNGPKQAANVRVEWVWYEGVDILREGEGVCYNTNYGTATARDGRRLNHVERPSTSNNMAFAGVAARDYAAKSGGQFIEIYAPGSKGVNVALGVDTVIDTGILTFQAGGGTGAGRFVKAGYVGRGSIVPRQTVTAVIEASMVGAWSLATDGVTLTMADTAGLSAGDTVVLLGSEDEGTSKRVAPGKYTIASVTNGTVVVLSTSAVVATPGAALTCTGYAYTGNPKCQADLLEGEESGGVEFLSPPNAGGAGLAYMANGVSYICGGVTLAADSDVTFAQGTVYGQRKGFICLGTMTTSDVTVDLATNGFTMAGGALAEVNAIDAALDGAHLVWHGVWRCINLAGAAAEA
jgi:hypothetical protein